MATVGTKEARLRFSELIRKASKGEDVIITRRGIPIARLVPTEDQKKRSIREAIEDLKKFRRGKFLRGNLKKMISEGRM